MTEETIKLVEACEDAWSWYTRAQNKRAAAKSVLMKDYYEGDIKQRLAVHQAARKKLADHLEQMFEDRQATRRKIEDCHRHQGEW